jgi:hypothetical protein
MVDLDAPRNWFRGAAYILLYQDIIVFAPSKSTAARDLANEEKPGSRAG